MFCSESAGVVHCRRCIEVRRRRNGCRVRIRGGGGAESKARAVLRIGDSLEFVI